VRTAASGLVALSLLACGGFLEAPPEDAATAFRWAGITKPPDARDVAFTGSLFGDGQVYLLFVVPNDAVEPFVATLPCTLGARPVGPDTGASDTWPFNGFSPDLPGWEPVPAAGARGCRSSFDEGSSVVHSVRLDPVAEGVRVQIFAHGH
jgi:hypothetical protein